MGLFSKKKFNKIQQNNKVEKRHTIMIVDDEASNLSTLSSMLGDKYNLIEARDGLEAYEMLTKKIEPGTVSLIISDQRMPKLSGTELFCRLIPIMPKTIRIILTGYTDVSAILDSINKAQIYKFVVKPFDREDLLLTVARALEAFDMRNELDSYHQDLEAKIRQRTAELEEKNEQILATQNQLIIKEKLASTGILAAGVAHELKNPLNFVNNFASVSLELFKELKELHGEPGFAPGTESWDEAVQILQDLEQNTGLIQQHGEKANQIVHSMMNLSRSESNVKQSTDINELLTEFTSLALSSFQRSRGNFDAHIEYKYDSSNPNVSVHSQGLSRVVLNLVTNALESLLQKKDRLGGDFKPVVEISSQFFGDHFQFSISDNGDGIAPEHEDRIFNPFFTTKHNGSNIGLGLAVCHEVVVQEHHGKLNYASVPGSKATFVVSIPLSQ